MIGKSQRIFSDLFRTDLFRDRSFPGQIFSGTDGLTPIENSQARKVNAGEIPADRVGRDNMFHSWELALWIEERQSGRRVHPSGKVAVPAAA